MWVHVDIRVTKCVFYLFSVCFIFWNWTESHVRVFERMHHATRSLKNNRSEYWSVKCYRKKPTCMNYILDLFWGSWLEPSQSFGIRSAPNDGWKQHFEWFVSCLIWVLDEMVFFLLIIWRRWIRTFYSSNEFIL